jgi:dCTP deaminase
MLNASEIVGALSVPTSTTDQRLTVVPCPDLDDLTGRGGTSIDLRLGRWFRSFKQTRVESFSLVGPIKGRPRSRVSRTRPHFVPFGDKFVLHPGRFVLGVTLEWLQLPSALSAYVTGKSSLGRHGLVIETAAGVHPGFSGCLTLELANVGEVPLEIYPGMHVCQLFFHRTMDMPKAAQGSFSGSRKPVLRDPSPDPVFLKLQGI